MKTKYVLSILASMTFVLALVGCESRKEHIPEGTESVEIAKEANDSAFTDRKAEKDADFIVNAVASNYAEIKIAQLARNKSVDRKVKDMATTLENDHMKILNELKAYADKNGISVPLEEGVSDSRVMEDLEQKSVDKFDKEWCKSEEERQHKSINNFEARLERTDDPELKTWISETIPGLKGHLDMLKNHDQSK